LKSPESFWKTSLVLGLAGLVIFSQPGNSEARSKAGRTVSELEHPQGWGEATDENVGAQGNSLVGENLTGHRRIGTAPAEGAPSEPKNENSNHILGASESMDKLFPMGTPTPESDSVSREIKGLIHDLGGESHQRQHAVERLSQIGNRAVPSLLLALKDPYAFTRVGALAALANIRDKATIPAMERLLDDRGYQVRGEAAKSLGLMRSKDSLPKLVACLEDKEPRVRREAVIALGKLKIANARDALISALQTTSHADVRQQAAQELSAFPGSEAVEALLQCTRSTDRKLCVFAIHALGEIGDPAARERLSELSQYTDPAIRSEAVNALKELE